MRIAGFVIALAGVMVASVAQAGELQITERPLDADVVVSLYPGTAPGSENATWKEQLSVPPWGGDGRLVRNVVRPTLTVFQPLNKARATHTAVIIAPGGGFRWLSIDSEGYDVARRLAAEGYTAIVLKYRLTHTPDEESDFRRDAIAFLEMMQASKAPSAATPEEPALTKTRLEWAAFLTNVGVEDGLAAVKYVRDHASELDVDKGRIGIMGFSAGAAVANVAATKYDAQSQPNFVGLIYGAIPNPAWRKDGSPVFLAVSADDPVAYQGVMAAYQSLRQAGQYAELHVFGQGGHGFGMLQRGLTTDLWFDEFSSWLAARGYETPKK